MLRRFADLYFAAFAGFVLSTAHASEAQAARLVVTIQGTHSPDGYVLVALFSKPEGFPDGDFSIQHTKVKAATEGLTVLFDNVAAGTYAVGAYHDENNNGRLDTNFFGYPTEGYALSNGIRAVISRPRFADASFVVGPTDAYVTLDIKY